MSDVCSKICALILILAMTPGAGELLENATHLLREGHLAHVAAEGDQHNPAGPEHGCTPLFHSCGCHASLAFVTTPKRQMADLHAAGFSSPTITESRPTGFWPSIDRPPQA